MQQQSPAANEGSEQTEHIRRLILDFVTAFQCMICVLAPSVVVHDGGKPIIFTVDWKH